MAHELEIRNGKAQMFSVREVPWHKLGKILDNPPTSEEAIVEAGLDWTVEPKQIFWNDGTEYHAFPKRMALVRNIDGIPLSVVSNTYKPLQNKDAFGWFDPIIKDGLATYETAGSLQGGKRIWVMAKLKDSMEIVAGDEVRRYILLCNGHDGLTGILIQPTPIRIVCQNTLLASLGTGLVNTIWHHGAVDKKMDRVKHLLGLAEQDFENRKESFKAMAKYQITNDDMAKYISALIPDANDSATDRVKQSVEIARERIEELHETGFGHDIAGVKGTMWGLYNSAVEYAEYDMPKKVRDVGNYALFGLGGQFKRRAYDKAIDMIGA